MNAPGSVRLPRGGFLQGVRDGWSEGTFRKPDSRARLKTREYLAGFRVGREERRRAEWLREWGSKRSKGQAPPDTSKLVWNGR